MEMKKAKIGGKMVDVVSLDEYRRSPESYIPNSTAIEFPDQNVVLPVIGKFDPTVGVSVGGVFSKINMPDEEHMSEYSTDNIIDLSDVNNIGELMKKQELVRDIEYEILTTVDDIFQPRIGENDSPAMKAMKTAVIEKQIDFNKYAARFGSNANNDKRQYNKSTISMQMLERQCKALDIKATLILEDASDDIPNPIGRKISVELTEGGSEDD